MLFGLKAIQIHFTLIILLLISDFIHNSSPDSSECLMGYNGNLNITS